MHKKHGFGVVPKNMFFEIFCLTLTYTNFSVKVGLLGPGKFFYEIVLNCCLVSSLYNGNHVLGCFGPI